RVEGLGAISLALPVGRKRRGHGTRLPDILRFVAEAVEDLPPDDWIARRDSPHVVPDFVRPAVGVIGDGIERWVASEIVSRAVVLVGAALHLDGDDAAGAVSEIQSR